jgi:hypothetical protein
MKGSIVWPARDYSSGLALRCRPRDSYNPPSELPFRGASVRLLSVFAFALLLAVTASWPLGQRHHVDPALTAQGPPETPDQKAIRERMQRAAAKEWNKERQARLKQDTDKLLALATELKTQVDKSNENVLSLDVIKKADEIEKLAHSVKDKMKSDSY